MYWRLKREGVAKYMLKAIEKNLKALENEPRGYEYAFFLLEHAVYDRDLKNYARAKEYGAAAIDLLSTLPPSDEVDQRLNDAADIVVDACNELDDWSGIDRLKITRLNYELAPRFRSDHLLIEAAVEYADALLAVDQLSEHEELQKFIVNNCLKLSRCHDGVMFAHKIKRVLTACGSKKRANKMFERILLYRIENCSDNIHNDCREPERQRDWNLSQADEVIELLKELGRKDDLKWWTAYRELIASRRNDRRRVR